MRTYLIRSIKYLIWLALLFTLIFVLMIRTNTARAGGEQMHPARLDDDGDADGPCIPLSAFRIHLPKPERQRCNQSGRHSQGGAPGRVQPGKRDARTTGFPRFEPGQKSPFAMGGHNHRHSARRSTRDRRHPQRGRSDGIPPETGTRTRAVTCRIPDALQTNRKAKSF